MHPILIATVALVGLPILLHLLMKQEPKRLPFPALRLLKIKKKTNQRKLRLRHWLLLAMRMLLIALFGLTLYQPTFFSEGTFLTAEQPVNAVLVIDTSPGMGYRVGPVTRLDEARRRALELLDDLPTGSRVAIIDPADTNPGWEQTVSDARTKLEAIREPHGAAVPVSVGVAAGYQLLRTADQESEQTEPMPRLIAVFTDRSNGSWDAKRNDDLVKFRDTVPAPPPSHAVFDVGVDKPADVAITAAELRPQIVSAGQPVRVTVTVSALGPDVTTAVVKAKLDDATSAERKPVPRLVSGSPAAVAFEFNNLARGVHQVEFALETDDNLPANNVRYLTFKVAESRKILTLADDPDDASFWAAAHAAKGEFECDVKRPNEQAEWSGYEAVCLINVADLGPLSEKLKPYLARGGKVIVAPGPNALLRSYDGATNEWMPGTPKTIVSTLNLFDEQTDPRYFGVNWATTDDADLKHPLLSDYVKWKRQGNIDVIKNPRKIWRFWDTEPAAGATVAVWYADSDDRAKRHPAVLEKAVGPGKVILLTTRLDPQFDRGEAWNDTWLDPTWAVAWPHQLLVYLATATSDANFNFTTGDAVPVPIPKGTTVTKLQLSGPGVKALDATIDLAERQSEVRLPASRTTTPGNFRVTAGPAKDGFSLNAPATESDLNKLDAAAFEPVTGPNSVVPVEKSVKLRDLIVTKFNQPVDLFPWLLIGVLILLAVEGVLANRFYRKV